VLPLCSAVGDTPKHWMQEPKKGVEPALQADTGFTTVSSASASNSAAARTFGALALMILGVGTAGAPMPGGGAAADDGRLD